MIDLIQDILTHMTERGMTQVMTQGDGFSQILIEIQGTAYSASYLRDLKGVGEPCYIMVSLRSNENLRLVLEAAKSLGMDNAVSVTLEGSTYWTGLFRSESAP
jgi:hypothetical protein